VIGENLFSKSSAITIAGISSVIEFTI
jgi:hypothetical protein